MPVRLLGQAVRVQAAGTIARVSAPEIEGRVLAALKGREMRLCEDDAASGPGGYRVSDRTLVEMGVSRITIHESRLEIILTNGQGTGSAAGQQTASLPWTAPTAPRMPWLQRPAQPTMTHAPPCSPPSPARNHGSKPLWMAPRPHSPRSQSPKTWQRNTFASSRRWPSSHLASSKQSSMEIYGRG